VRNGRRIAHGVCELVDENDQVVARADANLVKTEFEPESGGSWRGGRGPEHLRRAL
jgi:hypothetical protein